MNIGSTFGSIGFAWFAAYSASKFGLRIFSLALNQELEGSPVKVAVVSPGPVDTGFIMDNIDEVTDITFSQPMSTAQQVGAAIVAAARLLV